MSRWTRQRDLDAVAAANRWESSPAAGRWERAPSSGVWIRSDEDDQIPDADAVLTNATLEGLRTGLGTTGYGITVNGTIVDPTCLFRGDSGLASDASTWTDQISGTVLSLVDSGAAPTRTSAPFDAGYAASYSAAQFHRDPTGTPTLGDIGTNDFVIAALIRAGTAADTVPMQKSGGTPANGWAIIQIGHSYYTLRLTQNGSLLDLNGWALSLGTWDLVVWAVDRDEATAAYGSRMARNGTNASSRSVSTLAGNADSTAPLEIGGSAANTFDGAVAMFGLWRGAGLFPGGAGNVAAMDALAAEMHARLDSKYLARHSDGAATPTVNTRASAKTLERYDDGSLHLYRLGASWLGTGRKKNAAGTHYVAGYDCWPQATNKSPVSTGFAAADGWTVAGAAAVVQDDASFTPMDGQTADKLTVNVFGAAYIQRYITGFSNDTDLAAGLWIKRVSTSGVMSIRNPYGVAYGDWRVDFAGLPDAWVRLTHHSPYVTVANSYGSDGSGRSGFLFGQISGGPLTFHAWGSFLAETGRLEAGPDIITAGTPVTRAGDALRYALPSTMADNQKGVRVVDLHVANHDAAAACIGEINDGGSATLLTQILLAAAGDVARWKGINTTDQWEIDGTTDIADGEVKSIRVTWQSNLANLQVDGAAEGTPDTTCTPPQGQDRWCIGYSGSDGGSQVGGLIARDTVSANPNYRRSAYQPEEV